VVDDWDMRISHVIRGDDHVNNTPRQINIMRALNAPLPRYGHLPLIHGADGQKLSKRHGAIAVTQFDDEGYLREAVVNYLGRLGWSHGDQEQFTREQFVEWFDGQNINKSAARFDYDKLKWLNNLYLRSYADADLAALVLPRLSKRGVNPAPSQTPLASACGLWKERAQTLEHLADLCEVFYREPVIAAEDHNKHLATPMAGVKAAVQELAQAFDQAPLSKEAIAEVIKGLLVKHALKMPHLAVPVRLLVFGLAQTPSLDAMLAAMPAATVQERLKLVE
jgi:glutamyl-tRNA synthetase